MADPISNLGVLVGDRSFFDTTVQPDQSRVFQFEIQVRSSFSAALNPYTGNRDLELRDSNGVVLARSNNPDLAADAFIQTLDPGIYTIQVSPDLGGTNIPDIITGFAVFGLKLKARFDFTTELIWRNSQTDQTGNWSIENDQFKTGGLFSQMPQIGNRSDWKLIDTFDSSATRDRVLVWRNDEIDQTAVWTVSGNQFQSGKLLGGQLPAIAKNSGWKLISSGLEDGNLRLIWRNANTDETGIWNFNQNNEFVSGQVLKNAPKVNSGWQLIDSIENGTSDFSLVWRNANTDETGIWNIAADQFVDGAVVKNAPFVGSNSNWKLIRAANLDDNSVLLWRNAVTDETGVWLLKGTDFLTGNVITDVPKLGANSAWEIAGLSNRIAPLTSLTLGSRSTPPFDFGRITLSSRFSEVAVPAQQSLSYRFTVTGFQRLTLSSPSSEIVRLRIDPEGYPVTAEYREFPLGTVELAPLENQRETTYILGVFNKGTSAAPIEFSFDPILPEPIDITSISEPLATL